MNFPSPFPSSFRSRLLLALLATATALLAEAAPPPAIPPSSSPTNASALPVNAADAPIVLPAVEVIATAEKSPLAVSFDPKPPPSPSRPTTAPMHSKPSPGSV